MSSKAQNKQNGSKYGILLAISEFPDGGASAMRLQLIARAIKQGGLGIHVAILHAANKSPIPGNDSIAGEIDGVSYEYLNGRTVRPSSIFGSIWDTLRGIGGFVKEIIFSRDKPDFVIFYTPNFWKMIVPLLAVRLRGIPIFIEVCEVWSAVDKSDLPYIRNKLAATGNSWLEYIIPRISCGIIPISYHIYNFYLDRDTPDERMFLMPILVDMDCFKYHSSSQIQRLKGVDYILYSGSLGEKDGVQYMLEAFEKILYTFPNIHFVFTGNITNHQKEKILSMLHCAVSANNIIFVGFLQRNELIRVYQNSRALLCCRSNSPFANYGFPTKLGEYLATGIPVITTNVGDVEYYLENEKNAFIAEPENSDSIAKCILDILTDTSRAARIGLNGQKVAQKYFLYSNYSQPIANFLLQACNK